MALRASLCDYFKREIHRGARARDEMNSQVSRKEEKQKDDWSFRGRKEKKKENEIISCAVES